MSDGITIKPTAPAVMPWGSRGKATLERARDHDLIAAPTRCPQCNGRDTQRTTHSQNADIDTILRGLPMWCNECGCEWFIKVQVVEIVITRNGRHAK